MANIGRALYTIETLISLYDWLVIVITGIIGFILCQYFGKKKYGHAIIGKSVLWSSLFMYLAFILFITLIGRAKTEKARAKWIPLWTWYDIIKNHDIATLEELVLNIIFFIPLGMLLFLLIKLTVKQAFVYGLLLSSVIEVLQYVTHRGYFEWDDILHNAVGCVLGVVIINKIILKIKSGESS